MPHVPIRRLVAATLLACAVAAPAVARAQAAPNAAARLQAALEAEVAANLSLPGEVLLVSAPTLGLDTTLVAGVSDRASGRALQRGDAFRVASVTKTFTAAAILRLVEEGRLGLDDAIARHLPAAYDSVLRAGGYRTDSITVRHLLTHTSGLYDYATDQRFYAAALGDPMRRWTRMEQVRAAMEWAQPQFAPGTGYHYSDTGYILLGEMLERMTGGSLAAAYRSLLRFEELGMRSTYLETLEPVPATAGTLSHPYLGEMDTRPLDPSFDLYGGGGLVSSAGDLARFYRALLRGEVFRDPATLQQMLTIPATNERSPGGAYGMGIQRMTIRGQVCWGHTGFWGTLAHHCPGPDVTIVRHVNQAQPDEAFIMRTMYDHTADALGLRR